MAILRSQNSHELTAVDVMKTDVVILPQGAALTEAATLLQLTHQDRAAVVDDAGHCTGVLTASDFLGWIERGCPGESSLTTAACAYQEKGRLLTGASAMICTREEGTCSLQVTKPLTGGRHCAICMEPTGIFSDWYQESPGFHPRGTNVPGTTVAEYMNTQVARVQTTTPLEEVARILIDSHLEFVLVVDEAGQPVGEVSSTIVLSRLASQSAGWSGDSTSGDERPGPEFQAQARDRVSVRIPALAR